MFKQTIFVLAINIVSASVYYGKGEIYFSHMYKYSESGTRMVYRPEHYQIYSPLGSASNCYFGAKVYSSEYSLNNNYYDDIIARSYDWATMEWDYDGNYYYYKNYDIDIKKGYLIGFGIAITNDDNEVIYNDTYQYWNIQQDITYCELDEEADYNDKKCSEILDGYRYADEELPYNGYASDDNSSTSSAGKIAIAVIVPLVIIALVVGVGIYIKKRRAGPGSANNRNVQNTTPANTAIPMNQLPPNTTTQPGQVNPSYTAPAYQPAAQPPIIYQPPLAACHPPPVQPPPYQPPVIQPAVVQPAAIQPSTVRPLASAPPATSLLTPQNLKLAAGAIDVLGSAADAFSSFG